MKNKICRRCQCQFEPVTIHNGKKKYHSNRNYCYDCSPFGSHVAKGIRSQKTKRCLKCGQIFPYKIEIDGKIRSAQSRRYCYSCSPIDGGNNRNLHRTTKLCIRCNGIKPLEEFHPRKGKRYSYCKLCMREFNCEYRLKAKVQAVEYLGGKCSKCGYNRCLAALDFHHVDSSEKEKLISRFKTSLEKMKPELDKCVLLCSNCHRETHSQSWQFPRQL